MATPITPNMLAKSGTEHGEQVAFFCWAARQSNAWSMRGHGKLSDLATGLTMMFAIPNGGDRGERRGAIGGKLKAEGVKKGVPDILLPVAIWRGSIDGETGKELSEQRFHGLFVEMKRESERAVKTTSKGGMSDEQIWYRDRLTERGYKVTTCYNWREARDAVLDYLDAKQAPHLMDMEG